MFALAAHLTGSQRAAFIAALLFGFYPYRFQHYPHLELQMTYWMPLALLASHRFLVTQRVSYAMGGLTVATLLTIFFVPALYAAWFRVARVSAPDPAPSAAPVAA